MINKFTKLLAYFLLPLSIMASANAITLPKVGGDNPLVAEEI